MKIFKIAALGLILATSATVATAGGYVAPVTESAPAVQETTWDGWYAGGGVGRGQLETSIGEGRENFVEAFGGYRRDLGNVVVGAEGGVQHSDNLDAFSVAGQVGYDAGKFLPYVSAGATRFDTGVVTDTVPTVGLGVDYAVSDNMIVGVKYTNAIVNETYYGVDVDNIQTVAVRAAYRF